MHENYENCIICGDSIKIHNSEYLCDVCIKELNNGGGIGRITWLLIIIGAVIFLAKVGWHHLM